jgi:hypothetical protein
MPRSVVWTDDPPKSQGWYWHWNGDLAASVNPISVKYSGTSRTCFVAMGQLGIEKPIDCEEFGGWWSPMQVPEVPATREERRKCFGPLSD